MSAPFDYLPEDWSAFQKNLYGDAFGDVFYSDRTAEVLYNEAFFNFDAREGEITALREALEQYMMSEYGVDFNEVFDWDAWRENYEGEG